VTVLEFLAGKVVFLVIFLLVLVVFAAILFVMHKRLNTKVVLIEKKQQQEGLLVREIEAIKNSQDTPDNLLTAVNEVARSFLKDTFWINKALDYSEIRDIFEKKNKKNISFFCSLMLDALYSGRSMRKEDINRLVSSLEKIVGDERPDLLQIAQSLPSGRIDLNNLGDKGELPFRLPKIYREEIVKQLSSLDEVQIEKAYKEIQLGFKQAFDVATKNKDKETLRKLEIFRQAIMVKIKEYSLDPSKIIDLVQTISSGAKVISTILSSAS